VSDCREFEKLSDLSQWPLIISADSKVDGADARRLFHGRGQSYVGFEYLTVDYFSPVLWIVLYRDPDSAFWADFVSALTSSLQSLCSAAIVQSRYHEGPENYCLWGKIPESFTVQEAGLRYQVNLNASQNIGYFMDMQPTRHWLSGRVQGKRLLNLFAYTCAFSVAAEAAGADAVVNIDMSRSALALGRENHSLNRRDDRLAETRFLPHDILKSWGKLRKLGPFDVLICDPPSRQRGSFDALKDYAKLVRRFVSLVSEGGDILLCLNAPYIGESFLHELMAEHCPGAVFVTRLAGREDFPEANIDQALKVLHYRL
jgi:23S rRNA (cytosine1962-C5)-methyltransferase